MSSQALAQPDLLGSAAAANKAYDNSLASTTCQAAEISSPNTTE
jgi:hypothetical protein